MENFYQDMMSAIRKTVAGSSSYPSIQIETLNRKGILQANERVVDFKVYHLDTGLEIYEESSSWPCHGKLDRESEDLENAIIVEIVEFSKELRTYTI